MANGESRPAFSWGHVGSVGGVVLALYLLLVGVSAIWGEGNIPGWVHGVLAVVAGLLILVGK